MKSRAYTYWVVVLSLFFAYLFAIVPLPEWSLNWRPEWVLLFVFYWTMALPYRIGLGFAWLAGLLLDVLEGGMLGLNALTLMLVAYIALSLHQRLRMYTPIQQSGVVLIVSFARIAAGALAPSSYGTNRRDRFGLFICRPEQRGDLASLVFAAAQFTTRIYQFLKQTLGHEMRIDKRRVKACAR
jgi:rod shape-determining protein MreD